MCPFYKTLSFNRGHGRNHSEQSKGDRNPFVEFVSHTQASVGAIVKWDYSVEQNVPEHFA